MSRSIWKGPFYDSVVLKKVNKLKSSGLSIKKINRIKLLIWSRRSTILPEFVGITFSVYNGLYFYNIKILKTMVGYKFGNFVPTKKQFRFKKSKNK